MVQRAIYNGTEWLHVRAKCARGVVFVPPLIGGDGLQQVRLLRRLSRFGFDLISFNYAGHGQSKGRFTLGASIRNCLTILDVALTYCRQTGMPLFGLASCYATLPLLHASCMRNEPMQKMVLINAIPRWSLRKICTSFLRHWRRSGSWADGLNQLPTAIRAFVDDLLPGVVHRPQAFGVLVKQRVQWPRLIWELLSPAPLQPESLRHTPVMCIYGRKDRLLQQMGFHDWRKYELLIQSVSPHTRFLPLDAGHFLAHPHIRYRLTRAVADFFGCDQTPSGPHE